MGEPEEGLMGDPRWELAERVANSRHLQKAPRLRDFLLHVCKQTILGHLENLTEHQIGCAVFERRPDYSPADDSIVRVQARQLRLRLAEYFSTEGKGESTVIFIPKGGYAPIFRDAGAPVDEEILSELQIARADGERGRRLFARMLIAMVILGLSVACVALILQNRRLQSVSGGPPASGGPPSLLSMLFNGTKVTNVVLGDAAFGNMQGILGARLSLEDYLKPGFPGSVMPPGLAPEYVRVFQAIGGTLLCGFGNVVIAQRLTVLAERNRWRLSIRHARELTTRELADGNLILLGSRMSNPWVSLFDKELVFQSEWDVENQVLLFRDTKPLQGGRTAYASAGPNGIPGSAFAVIALLFRSDSAGEDSCVMILEGTKAEATEAAWDFVADPSRRQVVLGGLGKEAAKTKQQRSIEILLETKVMGGSHGEVIVRSVRAR